jgi:hypothetical protein
VDVVLCIILMLSELLHNKCINELTIWCGKDGFIGLII